MINMNSTSFTSYESDTASSKEDKMANIDTSSTAHLTLNPASCLPVRTTPRDSNPNSDSDPDRSPSVTVMSSTTAVGTNILQHHYPQSRSAQLLSGSGFSLTNRLHLAKQQQRTLWSRANSFERMLMLAIILLSIAIIMLFTALVSVFMSREELLVSNGQAIGRVVDHDAIGSMKSSKCAMSDRATVQIGNKNYCLTPNCVKVAASVIEAIDTSVDPCDDFYMYSCGDWIKSNPLPDGKSNWGTFSKLWQDNQSIMRAVLEVGNFKPGSAEEKAWIYYESCMDRNDTVEKRGAKPIQDLIDSAGGWNISGQFDPDTWDLQNTLQIYHNQYNRGGLFSWAVGADERNSTRNIIQLDQGALGLPSRDYYLNKTDKNSIMEAYLFYMVKVAELMGGSNVEEQMKDVIEFEKKIAAMILPQDQRRDDERMYHKFTLKELTMKAPFLNWTKYFDDAFEFHSRTAISFSSDMKFKNNQTRTNDKFKNQTKYSVSGNEGHQQVENQRLPYTINRYHITEDENIVVYSPEYMVDLSKLVMQYSKTRRGKITLANYLAWCVIESLVATLPKNFREASKMLRRALIGSENLEVSWRYCVTDTNQVMGFALGSLFVRRVFQGNSKVRAEEMIYNIRNAFKDNLASLAWMDDRTRHLAREKADHIKEMIGFPDYILNPEKLDRKYEGLELDETSYFENNIKVNILSLRENMDKIGKLANKSEWEMTPPMVNAYYTPTKNQIVFPAGILQTPFYDLTFPNSLNYGAMGVVMGHELTHAFDDQGREYDKDGNLYQWWYNETLKNFEDRVKCFVNQYSSYKVDDTNLNGKQTLGENIADNGGLKAAFRAYEKWSESNPEPSLPGMNLTGKQLFFLGFAQVWCSINTPEALKLQVLNDPHAPAQYRVIGTLSNSHEFAREFNCPPNSKMNPEKKCIVW